MTLDTFIITICAIMLVAIYIYLKASGEVWYGICWGNVFRSVRRSVCRLLLKLHK